MKDQSSVSVENSLPSPTNGRRRWMPVLLALLIFTAGLVAGAGLTAIVAVKRLQHAIHHPEEAPARMAALLERRLRIDPKQKARIEAIVAKRQLELMVIRREFQPQLNEQLEQLHEDIGGELTESQRQQWKQIFDELMERWMPPVPPAAAEPPQ